MEGGTRVYCMKVAVLGDQAVGKTAAVRAFSGLTFEQEYAESRETKIWDCLLPTAGGADAAGEAKIRAQFWDCGTRALDDTRLRRMLDGALCCMVMYDVTDLQSFRDATDKWFKCARSLAPDSFVVLVGCKVDQIKCRAISVQDVEAFASENGVFFMEMSARAGTNVLLTLSILRIRAKHTMNARVAARFFDEDGDDQSDDYGVGDTQVFSLRDYSRKEQEALAANSYGHGSELISTSHETVPPRPIPIASISLNEFLEEGEGATATGGSTTRRSHGGGGGGARAQRPAPVSVPTARARASSSPASYAAPTRSWRQRARRDRAHSSASQMPRRGPHTPKGSLAGRRSASPVRRPASSGVTISTILGRPNRPKQVSAFGDESTERRQQSPTSGRGPIPVTIPPEQLADVRSLNVNADLGPSGLASEPGSATSAASADWRMAWREQASEGSASVSGPRLAARGGPGPAAASVHSAKTAPAPLAGGERSSASVRSAPIGALGGEGGGSGRDHVTESSNGYRKTQAQAPAPAPAPAPADTPRRAASQKEYEHLTRIIRDALEEPGAKSSPPRREAVRPGSEDEDAAGELFGSAGGGPAASHLNGGATSAIVHQEPPDAYARELAAADARLGAMQNGRGHSRAGREIRVPRENGVTQLRVHRSGSVTVYTGAPGGGGGSGGGSSAAVPGDGGEASATSSLRSESLDLTWRGQKGDGQDSLGSQEASSAGGSQSRKLRPHEMTLHNRPTRSFARKVEEDRLRAAQGGGGGGGKGPTRADDFSSSQGAGGRGRTRSSATAPDLFVDINLEGRQIGTVAVRDGDNPAHLASEFVRKHHLPASTTERLTRLLTAKVASFHQEEKDRKRAESRSEQRSRANRASLTGKEPDFRTAARSRRPTSSAALAERPLVGTLHVKVGKGRIGKLVVREGDEPRELVSSFARTYGLKKAQAAQIEQRVRTQLQLEQQRRLERLDEQRERSDLDAGARGGATERRPALAPVDTSPPAWLGARPPTTTVDGSEQLPSPVRYPSVLTQTQRELLHATLGWSQEAGSSGASRGPDSLVSKEVLEPVFGGLMAAAAAGHEAAAGHGGFPSHSHPGAPPPPPPPPLPTAGGRRPGERAAAPEQRRHGANQHIKHEEEAAEAGEERDEDVHLFNLDVNLGGGRCERIAVRLNDDLAELAQDFCAKHRLPAAKVSRVQFLLEEKLMVHARAQES